MSWDDISDGGNGLSTSDVLETLAGIITVVGAAVCTLDRIHRETGLLRGNSTKSQSGSKKK